MGGSGGIGAVGVGGGVPGTNDVSYCGEPVIVLGPEHAASIAAEGYSKTDVKRWLAEHAVMPLAAFSAENVEHRMRPRFPERLGSAGPQTPVPVVQSPDDLVIVVIGGAGKHSAFIPTFGPTRSVTRAIARSDGTPAASVEDFMRG